MTASDAVSALVKSSPLAVATAGLICINAGLLMYLLARNLVSNIACLLPTNTKHSTNSEQRSNQGTVQQPHGDLAGQALVGQASKAAPGKSIKKLLKENKKLSAMHSHEKVPQTELFVMSLKGHSAAVLSIDISGDSTRVVTTCEDHVIRVFYMNKLDYSNFKPPLTRIPLKQMPIGAAFWGAPDRLGICSAGLGEVVNLSTVAKIVHGGAMPTPRQVASAIHDGLPIIQTCFAPSSPGKTPLMATLTKTKEAKVITGDGSIIATVQPNGIENYQISLSPDGRFLAVTTFSTDVKIWELQWAKDGTFLRCVKVMDLGHSKGVASMAFNVDGTKAATSCKDGSFRLWNLDVRFHQNEDAKLLKKVNLNRVYNHMAWCPNDLVACAHGNELHWMNGVELCCQILDAHDGEITDISCTPRKVKIYAEQYFAVTTASRDGKARIWKCPEIC